jgi:hypothetical protein
MAILTYDGVKDKASTLRAMTSLDREEFERLAETFEIVWNAQQAQAGHDAVKGGRPPVLRTVEQKLLFILFYLKTYPLQEVLGHLFGLSQGQANEWIHRLSDVLKETLEQRGDVPARLPAEMLQRLTQEELQDYGIDGTERHINRPEDDERQRQYYSGKKRRIR